LTANLVLTDIDYVTGKCTPIIHMLAKSAKLKWGMGHRALKVIYKGAIEPTKVGYKVVATLL